MTSAPYTLVLLRHGESEWNAKNQFTGWVDVPLNEKGRGEAERSGRMIADAGLLPDVLHTSVLRRAIWTLWHALDEMERTWLPVRNDWRLIEGASGARLALTAARQLAAGGGRYAAVSLCIGVGQGLAVILERA